MADWGGPWDEPAVEVRDLGIVDVNIIGSDCVGGLMGYNAGAEVTGCYATGAVGGGHNVGGVMGYNGGGVTNCHTVDAVSGTGSVGGLVGYLKGTVTQCYSTGAVSGLWFVGGLVGDGEFCHVTQCYSKGAVSGLSCVGGLVGSINSIFSWAAECYSTGSVSGDSSVGVFVGENNGNVSSSFWDIRTSGQATSDGGTGKMTAEMQTASMFLEAGWDFVGETVNGTEDIWSICEGTNYPRLVWQIPAADFVCPDGITIDDFVYFIEHWEDNNCDQSNDYCSGTDLDFSGTVDIDDLEILVNYWLAEAQ